MKMNNYLLIDKHNPDKGHHITIEPDTGCIWYNQAIKHDRHQVDKAQVPGHEGWFDFYKQEEVEAFGGHGYQEYIDQAWRKYCKEDKPLDQYDRFEHWFNQGCRVVQVLAVHGDEALGIYEMPNGREFLCIHGRNTKTWKRSQAIKTLPKYWRDELSIDDVQYLEQIGSK